MSIDDRSAVQEWGLRFFNRVLYDRLPGLYDAMDTLTLGVWWRLVSRALDYIPSGGRILEVGFGPGKLLLQLAARADTCAGLDLAWGMCRYTHHRLSEQGFEGCVTCGDAFQLPYATGTFDIVASTFALSGLREGLDALREMARVTAPEGQVVIVDIGLPASGDRLGSYLTRLWESMGDFLYDQPWMMRELGLSVMAFDEFGPGNHIRAVVGQKPAGN